VESHGFSRRRWLAVTGSALAGAALGGCATGAGAGWERWARPLSRRPFAVPRVTADRVIRSIVGLRPFRPAGFLVRGERMGEKVVVHNYGHGGGGVTLSWGSSALAVREAARTEERVAAVVGGGVMGLTTARLLQDRGWRVTLYTKDLPRHTTSAVAGGQWAPTTVFDDEALTPEFEAQFREAVRRSHHAFQALVGAGYGVRWIENYSLGDAPLGVPYYLRHMPELFPSVEDLRPGEHPFPVRHVRRMVTMMVEPMVFLTRLLSDFREAGGVLEVREFRHRSEVLSLPQPVVMNCAGLGAGALFGDQTLVPIRGQLAFLPPDPALDYLTVGGGTGVSYMFPRSDGILLGGSFERGVSNRRPDPETTERIVRGHRELFARMRS